MWSICRLSEHSLPSSLDSHSKVRNGKSCSSPQLSLIGVGVGPIIMPRTGTSWFGLNFLYDFSIHTSLCLALFATCHATIVTMYAPATALKGAEFETVHYVSKMILEQKYFVLSLCVLALTSLFLASVMNYWAKLPWPVALAITIVNMTGFVMLISEGLRVYSIFHPGHEIYLSDLIRSLSSGHCR